VGAPALCETRLRMDAAHTLHLDAHRQHPLAESIPAAEDIQRQVALWSARLPPAEVIGTLADPLDTRTEVKCLGENRAGNFFTDILLEHYRAQADLAVVHMGSLRGDRVYPAGDFTDQDLLEFYPFDNIPNIVRLTAPQLKEVLEHGMSSLPVPTGIFLTYGGLRVQADATRPGEVLEDGRIIKHGERIVRAEINGQAIDFRDKRRVFRVLCDSYMAAGGAGYQTMPGCQVLQRANTGANAILREALRRHSPISVPLDGRLRITGLPRSN
jgi:5'-nucleotidase